MVNFGVSFWFDLRCVDTISDNALINNGWSLGAAALRIFSAPICKIEIFYEVSVEFANRIFQFVEKIGISF